MTRLKTQSVQPVRRDEPIRFDGVLSGLQAGAAQSWGLLEVVALRRDPADDDGGSGFASPEDHLQLVEVPTYGTVVLRNTSKFGRLIVPMHVGFFQPGAQNHATSRVLVLEPQETLTVTDCFCIQAAQGGLLRGSQQRFLQLPLGLRRQALELRHKEGYSRLWDEIDGYTRHHGAVTGGHLERFLRPNFGRLQPLRHAFETEPGQIGAAYFVAGRLAGVEVAPNADYWMQVAPVTALYCYGPATLLAEQRGAERVCEPLDLEDLTDVQDLRGRLEDVRERELRDRAGIVQELAKQFFDQQTDEQRHGLRVVTLRQGDWAGQIVRDESQARYLSIFRDVANQGERYAV